MIAASCGIKISAVHHLVLWQNTRLTDGQTDVTDGRTDRQTETIATAIPCVALHAARQKRQFFYHLYLWKSKCYAGQMLDEIDIQGSHNHSTLLPA